MTEKWDLVIGKEACKEYQVEGDEIKILLKDEVRKSLIGKTWCTLDDVVPHIDANLVIGTLLEFEDKRERKEEITFKRVEGGDI